MCHWASRVCQRPTMRLALLPKRERKRVKIGVDGGRERERRKGESEARVLFYLRPLTVLILHFGFPF